MDIRVTTDGRVLVNYVQNGVQHKSIALANKEATTLHESILMKPRHPQATLTLCNG